MSLNTFHYIIIGAGASGLQLALAMLKDDFFKSKSIGIIEKKSNPKNDKTWCFWETGQGLYDKIIYKSWKSGYVIACNKKIDFDLEEYSYKMLRSIDFYKHAKHLIDQSENIHLIDDEVIELENKSSLVDIKCKKNSFQAKHVFDSRLPENYKPENSVNILQHFKGWFVETENKIFNPEQFCMMDYNLSKNNETSFIYVLPFSQNQALVESTFFSPKLVEDEVYKKYIKAYLKDVLKVKSFDIHEMEQGIIPMTSYPFYKNHTNQITKIGTSGGWVKSSTGYSFKNAERMAKKIIENIKAGNTPHHNLYKKRFKHYDKLFLDVLYHHNHFGEKLFYKMYKRNNIKDIFQFLDEQSHFPQELKIMFSITSFYFIKAFVKHAFQGFQIK
ncbi:lycopene cyclase family protein [Psychroflexus sp. MBR-150]|jgi:lycopene beta-cyclase